MGGTDATIVVVDDDPGCRELHRHWLSASHSVETAASGREALRTVGDDTDLVLLDREMPGLTGEEVVSRLRERGYDGYVVMVTGVRPDADTGSVAVDDYLVKPISERELDATVDRLTRQRDSDDHHSYGLL